LISFAPSGIDHIHVLAVELHELFTSTTSSYSTVGNSIILFTEKLYKQWSYKNYSHQKPQAITHLETVSFHLHKNIHLMKSKLSIVMPRIKFIHKGIHIDRFCTNTFNRQQCQTAKTNVRHSAS